MAINKRFGKHSQAANDFLEPKAVTGLTVTDVGTSRAYGNGAFNVSWTLPADSPAATSYDISTTPTTSTVNVATTSGQITGLASATSYTVKVIAKNAAGNSIATTSASVTATTVPQTPTAPTASTPSAGVDRVTWTAPATGGKAITNYYWASSDGKSGNTASTTVDVAQEQGTAQTYTVRADNANGSSGTSPASNSVTTTFSFVPFGFAPFGFSPAPPVFGFSPSPPVFGFSPSPPVFGFSPSPPARVFGFSPSPPVFGFSPTTRCIDQDTLVAVVGLNNTVEYKMAKSIKLGDMVWAASWDELIDESFGAPVDNPSPTLTNVTLIQTEIAGIAPAVKSVTVYLNGDTARRFSLEENILIKRNNLYQFASTATMAVGDLVLEKTESNEFIEVPVTSIDMIDEDRTVYRFDCEPTDTLIAGNIVVHNGKVFF